MDVDSNKVLICCCRCTHSAPGLSSHMTESRVMYTGKQLHTTIFKGAMGRVLIQLAGVEGEHILSVLSGQP